MIRHLDIAFGVALIGSFCFEINRAGPAQQSREI